MFNYFYENKKYIFNCLFEKNSKGGLVIFFNLLKRGFSDWFYVVSLLNGLLVEKSIARFNISQPLEAIIQILSIHGASYQ